MNNPFNTNPSPSRKMPKNTKDINGVAASATRLSGKTASNAFKQGNNAGMLFKKEAKAATNIHEYTAALQRLRAAEIAKNGDNLRGFS